MHETDPEKNRVLLAAFRSFLNDAGLNHTQIANQLNISPGTILGWMHGSIELGTEALIAIKHFLETNGSAYLREVQIDNQADREQDSNWHSFP